jgi:RNA polymerase sigma-70 factor, ECF subfamily
MPVALTDADLVRQALAGSQPACRELVARYASPVLTFVGRMVQNRALAEDLTQDTLLRAFQRLSTYDPQRKFLNWLLQIAHNVTVDHLRKKRRDAVSLDALLEEGHPGAVDDADRSSPAVQAERTALASSVDQALTRIRPEHRAAILLHYQEGLSVAEVSGILGVPIPTVKTYLHRGRKALAVTLSAQGWGPVETLRRAGP